MNEETDEFIRLVGETITQCDRAIADGKVKNKPWFVELGEEAKARLIAMKTNALSRGLPAATGSGLGISRALGEWAPDYLRDAGYELESFYINRSK
jgi:hypothetical protein